MDFKIERDFKRAPYMVTYFKGQEITKIKPADIIAFYKVRLDNVDKDFGFEIRKDDAGRVIIDSDDTLTEYLYNNGLKTKEINKIIERISLTIHTDFYKD
jgi:hypothetical protein